MLIELRAGTHTLATENGVLSAQDVQILCNIDTLDRQMAQERQSMLDQALAEARACVARASQEADAMMALAQAQADPQAITAAAQSRADQMLERARKDARRIRREAAEEGHEEGMRESVALWHGQQLALAAQGQRLLDAMQEKMVHIVMSAVERVIEATPREALFQRAAKSVQHLSRGAMGLKLKVCMQDHPSACTALESLNTLHSLGLQLEVAVDPALQPGACVFESELGVLDASLSLQIASLRSAMSKALERAPAASSADNEP